MTTSDNEQYDALIKAGQSRILHYLNKYFQGTSTFYDVKLKGSELAFTTVGQAYKVKIKIVPAILKEESRGILVVDYIPNPTNPTNSLIRKEIIEYKFDRSGDLSTMDGSNRWDSNFEGFLRHFYDSLRKAWLEENNPVFPI